MERHQEERLVLYAVVDSRARLDNFLPPIDFAHLAKLAMLTDNLVAGLNANETHLSPTRGYF